jgi:hypothetical protein
VHATKAATAGELDEGVIEDEVVTAVDEERVWDSDHA